MYDGVMTSSIGGEVDVIFLHNERYSTVCGHAIIAFTTLIAEAGRSQPSSTSRDDQQFTSPSTLQRELFSVPP